MSLLAEEVFKCTKKNTVIADAIMDLKYEERRLKSKLKLIDLKQSLLKRIQQASNSGKYEIPYYSPRSIEGDQILEWLQNDLGFEVVHGVEMYSTYSYNPIMYIQWCNSGKKDEKDENT